MIKARGKIGFHLLLKSKFWLVLFSGALLLGIRWTKGAGYLDLYSVLLKPILPGTAQREWIIEGEKSRLQFGVADIAITACKFLAKQ